MIFFLDRDFPCHGSSCFVTNREFVCVVNIIRVFYFWGGSLGTNDLKYLTPVLAAWVLEQEKLLVIVSVSIGLMSMFIPGYYYYKTMQGDDYVV